MSKSDQNAAKNQTKGLISTNNANEATAGGQLNSVLGTAQGAAASILPGVTAGYSDIAQTGGYDPSILGQVNNTFGDLASTGGISSGDATAMRDTAGDAARSAYSTGADMASRSSAATGGYGATGGSIATELARKGGEAASKAAVASDASITGMRQQGMVAGAQGLQQTAQAQAGNKLAALAGSTNIYGMNENQVSATVDQILNNYKNTGTLNNQDQTILTNLANQPGVFDKIVGTIGTLGGAAGGILAGLNGGKSNSSGFQYTSTGDLTQG